MFETQKRDDFLAGFKYKNWKKKYGKKEGTEITSPKINLRGNKLRESKLRKPIINIQKFLKV
tara:strand:- start:1687 stop:1872 length:186 start_codon:yes stop_codon:yes gene_type:complete